MSLPPNDLKGKSTAYILRVLKSNKPQVVNDPQALNIPHEKAGVQTLVSNVTLDK